jgi:hypothetical protein
MVDDLESMARHLRAELELLGSTADAQEAYLRATGTWPSLDELALNFDWAYGMTGQLVEARLLSRESQDLLDAISAEFQIMSGRDTPELWDGAALASAAEWTRVRQLSSQALAALAPVPA